MNSTPTMKRIYDRISKVNEKHSRLYDEKAPRRRDFHLEIQTVPAFHSDHDFRPTAEELEIAKTK